MCGGESARVTGPGARVPCDPIGVEARRDAAWAPGRRLAAEGSVEGREAGEAGEAAAAAKEGEEARGGGRWQTHTHTHTNTQTHKHTTHKHTHPNTHTP